MSVIDIRILDRQTVMGPNALKINRQLNKAANDFPDHNVKVAAIRGAITAAMQNLNPNATADFKVVIQSDGNNMQLTLDITATGINL